MAESNTTSTTLRVAIAGTLEFRDANGDLIGTVEMTGSLPLTNADETGDDNGLDNGS